LMSSSSQITRSEMPPQGSGIHLVELMHEGSMFCVYKARMNSKYVTLKTPRQPDSMLRDMLLREYELSHTLSHPSIVTTLAFSDTTPCGTAIIREYIEGVTLDEYLTEPSSKQELRTIERELLDAVDYLHRRGISHNDLKPENIIIGRECSVHIIDFGLSLSDDSAYRGCVGGTPEFTAPEVLAHGAVAGNASDIYSVGALLKYMYGGKRHARIAKRAMSLDPECRYHSIAQMRQAMRRESIRRGVLIALPLIAVMAAIVFAVTLGDSSNSSSEEREQVVNGDTATTLPEVARLEELFDTMDSIALGEQYRELAVTKTVPYRMEAQRIFDDSQERDAPHRESIERYFAQRQRALDERYTHMPSITILSGDEYTQALQQIEDIANSYGEMLHR